MRLQGSRRQTGGTSALRRGGRPEARPVPAAPAAAAAMTAAIPTWANLSDSPRGRTGQFAARTPSGRSALALETPGNKRRCELSDHVYKVVELVGSSTDSIEAAIEQALSRAGETVRNIRWFQVVETRGVVEGGRVAYYQVTLKVGFTLDG